MLEDLSRISQCKSLHLILCYHIPVWRETKCEYHISRSFLATKQWYLNHFSIKFLPQMLIRSAVTKLFYKKFKFIRERFFLKLNWTAFTTKSLELSRKLNYRQIVAPSLHWFSYGKMKLGSWRGFCKRLELTQGKSVVEATPRNFAQVWTLSKWYWLSPTPCVIAALSCSRSLVACWSVCLSVRYKTFTK